MAQRIIEAEARITATDNTGSTFQTVAAKADQVGRVLKSVGLNAGGSVESLTKVEGAISKLAGSMLAYAAASKAWQLAENVQTKFAKYDDLVRYQRVVMDINEEQQKVFTDQAQRASGTSGYSTLDIGKAQLDLAQRGVNKDFIAPIVDSAIAFGQATDVDLSTAAKTMEGIIFSTGKHLDDLAAAVAMAPKVVNEATRLTKIGGFTGEGVREYYEYAGLAGSSAGLSDQTIDTLGAIMHRALIPEMQAGVAVRALAGSLVAPTQKGLDAFAAMGVDYNKFASAGGLNTESFKKFMARRFGQPLSDKMGRAVGDIFADPEIVGSQDKFVESVVGATGDAFATGRDGKMRAGDAAKLTKAIKDYYKLSVSQVDSEGLLHSIIAAHPTLGQINAVFGPKQGARIMAALRDPEKFEEYHKKFDETPANYAESIGEARMKGYSGSGKRLDAQSENAEIAIGKAWDQQLTAMNNAAAGALHWFSTLPKEAIQGITGAAGELVGVGSSLGALKLLDAAFGTGMARGAAGLLGKGLGLVGEGVGLGVSVPFVPEMATLLALTQEANKGEKSLLPGGWLGDASAVPAPPNFSLGDIRSAVTGPMAEVKGSADLSVNVKVEPSDSFISRIVSAIRNDINVFNGGIGTHGSTGLSMPEVIPSP